MLNLSHIDNEIPENYETDEDMTTVVEQKLSPTKRVLRLLKESGGESLSIEDIAEETDLSEEKTTEILRRLCAVKESTREVYEDENHPGHFFATEPLVDRIHLGF
jgi:hypothetical protein